MRVLARIRVWLTKEVVIVPLRTYDADTDARALRPASWSRPADPDVRIGEGPEIAKYTEGQK